MKITRTKHKNGVTYQEVPWLRGTIHGMVRTWHRNRVLASEAPYAHGLLDGRVRQWNERGELLGEFEMRAGTGMQRFWLDSGRLQMELHTRNGVFHGPSRIWLNDGTLLSECFNVNGHEVGWISYQSAARKDPTLPTVEKRAGKPLGNSKADQRILHRVFAESLLERKDWKEAREWLQSAGTGRTLGSFRTTATAGQWVGRLYGAGATKVLVTHIDRDLSGREFVGGILAELPAGLKVRRAIRAVGREMKRAVLQPDKEIGEPFLYLLLG